MYLDLGCGIVRHTFMLGHFKFDAYGLDFSKKAINTVKNWAKWQNEEHLVKHFITGSARDLLYSDE